VEQAVTGVKEDQNIINPAEIIVVVDEVIIPIDI